VPHRSQTMFGADSLGGYDFQTVDAESRVGAEIILHLVGMAEADARIRTLAENCDIEIEGLTVSHH